MSRKMLSGIPTGKCLWEGNVSGINITQSSPIFSFIRFALRMTSKMLLRFSVVLLIFFVLPSLALPIIANISSRSLQYTNNDHMADTFKL